MPHYRALTRAVHTNLVPAGAFRGFGVPQTAIAQEQLYDELAIALDIDPSGISYPECAGQSSPTVTGQVLGEGVGIRACFEALRSRWTAARAAAERFNAKASGSLRRGVGVAGMWYGCGNTSLLESIHHPRGSKAEWPHCSSPGCGGYRTGLEHDRHPNLRRRTGRSHRLLRSGLWRYVDHARLRQDFRVPPDICYRQSRTHGRHGTAPVILRLANACEDAVIEFGEDILAIHDCEHEKTLSLRELPLDKYGYVLTGESHF